MNTRKLYLLTLVCIGIFVLSQSSFGIDIGKVLTSGGDQNNSSWLLFVPEDEEFTAMIPAWPTTRGYSVSTSYKTDREKILAHRQYGGYGNGLVFVIESFKAERPQRLWDDLLKSNVEQTLIFERDIAFDGVMARQYKSTYSSHYANYTYTRRLVRFMTKEHVYFLTLATLDETDPTVNRFLSSFRLRRPQDRITRTETQSLQTLPDKLFICNVVSSNDRVELGEPGTTVVKPSASTLPNEAIEQRQPLSLPLHQPKIVVRKRSRRLLLYSGNDLVRTYRVGLGLNPVGDKVREGDRRTPEGAFYIFTKNSKSAFYLSLGLSYPNATHAKRGLRDGLITKAQYH